MFLLQMSLMKNKLELVKLMFHGKINQTYVSTGIAHKKSVMYVYNALKDTKIYLQSIKLQKSIQ